MKKFIRNFNTNMRYAYCQVCNGKFHIKDLKRVDDIYNKQHGLIVCKKDYSKTNKQSYPFSVNEKLLSDSRIMNPEQVSTYDININDDRVPGKVQGGTTTMQTQGSGILLRWIGPIDGGSSGITGYKILVSSPQFVYYNVLVENTNNPAAYFIDTTTDISSDASYKIAAINNVGMGAYSDEIFWKQRVDYQYIDGLDFLVLSPEHLFITINTGDYIQVQI